MSSTAAPASADEQPKRKIAKAVVTPKRRYLFPHSGISGKAESLKDAHVAHKKLGPSDADNH
jgi:hypothetical protein